MATLNAPDLLLLDEPTASLDPKAAATVEAVIIGVVSTLDRTTIMVTQDMEQALRLGNRTLIVHGGRIVADRGVRPMGITPRPTALRVGRQRLEGHAPR